MSQQSIHLDQLPRIYKALQANKTKFQLIALDFIRELNKEVGFDDVMIRQGYQIYPYKSQFEKKKSLSHFEQFFGYVSKNMAIIESTYLQESGDKKLMEEAKANNQEQYNYLSNKNSISKFIRDEGLHYQKVLDKYLQNINGQLQKGVKSINVHRLFIELFKSEYLRIIINNQIYLDRKVGSIEADLGNTLIEYSKQVKKRSEEESKKQFTIAEEQILDFLTFWLKHKSKDNIFVVYARTRERLDKQQQKLIVKIQIPQKLASLEINLQKDNKVQQKIQKAIQQMGLSKIQQVVKQSSIQKVVEVMALLIQSKQNAIIIPQIRKTEPIQQFSEVELAKKAQIKTARTKEDLLNGQIKNLFKFGCQRRYKFDKNSTFQQISQSTKTMDIQKFLYFCNFFEILQMIHRQKAMQLFKASCVNRMIDFKKFQAIIHKMVVINSSIIDNLLKKRTFEVNKKRIMIHRDKKIERLSQYKFELRPVNGMDISTIQKQLTQRKLYKLAVREEKGKMAYDKREAEKEVKQIKKSNSQFGNKLSALDLESIRDSSFNPEKLLMSDPDHDRLWEDYQAKIWKKQKSSNNVLESILSKRIARGTRIIDKINSQISFGYV